jgi:hypothetical protein
MSGLCYAPATLLPGKIPRTHLSTRLAQEQFYLRSQQEENVAA